VDYHFGELFYHYTTRSVAFEHILPTGKLRFSPYARVNDPLENKRWRPVGEYALGGGAPDPERLKAATHAFAAFEHGAGLVWTSAKLLALTVDAEGYVGAAEPFGRGWSRARMWDQYAEQHEGVCLLFNSARLRRNILESLSSQNLIELYHKRVCYTSGGPRERMPHVDLAALKDVTPALVGRFIKEHNEELFFVKTVDWESEHEYRFVVTAPDVEFVWIDYGDALEGAIVGECFPAWQRRGAIDICQQVGAVIGQMNWSSGAPRPQKFTAGAVLAPQGPAEEAIAAQANLAARFADAAEPALRKPGCTGA
jgi:hypothetical protein